MAAAKKDGKAKAAKSGKAKSKSKKKDPKCDITRSEAVIKQNLHRASGQEALKRIEETAKAKGVSTGGGKGKGKGKAKPAAKAEAKKPAKKKPAAKKAAPAPAPAPAAKKPKKKQKKTAEFGQGLKRLMEGTQASMDEIQAKLAQLHESRSPGAKGKKKKKPKQVAVKEALSLNQALDAVAGQLDGISKQKLHAAMDVLAKEHGLQRASNPTHTPGHASRTDMVYAANPAVVHVSNPQFSAMQVMVGLGVLGVSLSAVDLLDRTLATMAPGDCKVYGDEAVLRLAQKPGMLRMGVQLGLAVVGIGGSYWSYKKGHPMLSAVVGAIGTAAGAFWFQQGLSKWVLPAIFSAKDSKEESFGNRVMPTEQKYVQENLDKIIKDANDLCEKKASKLSRVRLVQSYYGKTHGGLASGSVPAPQLTAGSDAQAGTAGVPRSDAPAGGRPPTPARAHPAPSRGEPRATTAAADAQAGTAGCRTGNCGGGRTQAKQPEGEWYRLDTEEWYTADGKPTGIKAAMPEREAALKAGVAVYQKSTNKFFDRNGNEVVDEPETVAKVDTKADTNKNAIAGLEGSLVPAGKKVAVVRMSDGTERVTLIDADANAGTAGAPAPAAPAAHSDVLERIASGLDALNSRVNAIETRVESDRANASAGVAAPPPVPVSEPKAAPVVEMEPARGSAPAAPSAPETFNLGLN